MKYRLLGQKDIEILVVFCILMHIVRVYCFVQFIQSYLLFTLYIFIHYCVILYLFYIEMHSKLINCYATRRILQFNCSFCGDSPISIPEKKTRNCGTIQQRVGVGTGPVSDLGL